MTKLLVQEYLENHSLDELKEEHKIKHRWSTKNPNKFILNYEDLAERGNLIVEECRGLVLRMDDFLKSSPIIGETEILAFPFRRFYNHGEGAAKEIDWQSAKFFEKLDGCFNGKTSVALWDGTVLSIEKIVKNKLTPTIIGCDSDGKLVPAKVVGWADHGTKYDWMKICVSEVRTSRNSGRKNRIINITPNHEIVLNGLFQPAIKSNVGDILTTWDLDLDNFGKKLCQDLLLGDGSITKQGQIEFGHKKEHINFTKWKISLLGECATNISKEYISGFGSRMVRGKSKTYSSLKRLKSIWYKKKKIIPKDLSWMDDLSIAIWYQDDGSLAHNDFQEDRAVFSTNGFVKKDVNRLSKKLEEMYGVSCTVFYSKGWNLRINSGKNKEINNFWKSIAPYMCDTMKYKLPKSYQNIQAKEIIPAKELKIKRDVKIVSIESFSTEKTNKELKKLKMPNRHAYDIQTSTGNYFADGILVHNSLCIVYWDDFLNEFCVATRNIPDADLPFDPITQKTYSDLFWEAFHETYHDAPPNLWKNMTYMFELCTPENQVVIRHDSYHVFLLGLRNNVTLKESSIDHLDEYLVCPNYELNEKNVFDFVLSRNGQEHEGIVVCDKNFNRIKIKDPAYGFHNKLKDAAIKSPRRMLELVLMGKDDDVRPLMQERYLNELERIVIRWNSFCDRLDQANLKLRYSSEFFQKEISRKDWVVACKKENLPIDIMVRYFEGSMSPISDWLSTKKNNDGTFPDPFLDRILLMIDE